jgi:putative heme-binding domain-containing protein
MRDRCFERVVFQIVVAVFACGLGVPKTTAADDYEVVDPRLKVVQIDSSSNESFLSIQTDGAGRVFVGGREALFVYEPAEGGGYAPRQLLYRFPNHSWVYGIEVRGDDVYAMTVTALYVLPGAATGRGELSARRLVWGMPLGHVHQGMHGLAWGPDGDLYLSTGDPLPRPGDLSRPDEWAHWTYFFQPAGSRLPYNAVGGFLRCRADGSRLQVVATGTRNSCDLAFDHDWNLFSHDNDHESLPSQYVPGRILHVTPHVYFSWPRGWMAEKQPDRADLLDTVVVDMGRSVPVGQAYYDDTYLPSEYRHNVLVARWGTRTLARYPLEPHGASFRAEEKTLLVGRNEARPVGVAVGRGGRVFTTIAYMSHNEGSPTYKSDLVMITRADDSAAHGFVPCAVTEVGLEKLFSELAAPSWSRQYRAFVELHRRGGPAYQEATRRLAAGGGSRAVERHLIWLAAASGSAEARAELLRLAESGDDRQRHHATRALVEFTALGAPREFFVKALADSHLPVRHAASWAFFGLDGGPPEELVANCAVSTDTYLRQTAALLLAEKAPLGVIERLCQADSSAERLAGVLSAGFRLTLPPLHEPLDPGLPLVPYGGDSHVVQYADARVDLSKLRRAGTYTFAEHWNRRPHTGEEDQLVHLLEGRLQDVEDANRLQARQFLALLNEPRLESKLASVSSDVEQRRLVEGRLARVRTVWMVGPFPDELSEGNRGTDRGLFERVHAPEQGAVDLTVSYRIGEKKLRWQKFSGGLSDLREEFALDEPAQSYYAYFRIESSRQQPILFYVGSDDGVRVWQNGNVVFTVEETRGALPLQDVVPLDLVPGSNEMLVRLHNVEGLAGLYLHYRSLGGVTDRAPEPLGRASLAARLRGADASAEIAPAFLDVDWELVVRGGSSARGKELFEALSCNKCHGLQTELGAGAPSLADARKRFTLPYLVESVLDPGKQVSPVFRGTAVVTKGGQVVNGLVTADTVDALEILTVTAERQRIAKNDIAERHDLEGSPMPQGIVKTPAELGDLLAYLLSQ